MQKSFLIFLIIFMQHIHANAQQKFNQKYGTEQDYKRLWYLNLLYIQSWIKSDISTYNTLLWADDFVQQNGANGILYPKNEIIGMFAQKRFEAIEYFYPENTSIQFVDSNIAMVFSKTRYKGFKDTTESLSSYNDVYVKRNGNWICVSANITPIGSTIQTINQIPKPVQLISKVEALQSNINKVNELNSLHAKAFFELQPQLLESILAEDYVLLSEHGLVYSKEDVLKQLKNAKKPTEFTGYSIENLQIRFVADNIAMVHALAVSNFINGIKKGMQYNDIYVNRNGTWVCVSGNNTPVKN